MKFIDSFKGKSPKYPIKYYDSIISQHALVGGRDDKLAYGTGKSFRNVYEIYIYATILGLRKDYKLPLDGIKTQKFWEIKNWRPAEVVDFIIMNLLVKSQIDLNKLEDLDENELREELTKLEKLLEEYAHGGFDLIDSAIKKDPHFFDNNEYSFVNLLDEI